MSRTGFPPVGPHVRISDAGVSGESHRELRGKSLVKLDARPRFALGAVLAALMTGAAVIASAPHAVAEQTPARAEVLPSSWAQTDSRTPHAALTSGSTARIGAWRDSQGRRHLSKTYFTFDISGFAGKEIISAPVRLTETAANNCAVARSTELWTAQPTGPITWAAQPSELVELPGPNGAYPCVGADVTWDAAAAVRAALEQGASSLTLVARMSGVRQGIVAFGRVYQTGPAIHVEYNSPPGVPTDLRMTGANLPCDGSALLLGGLDIPVTAAISDPDGPSGLTARFAFWSTDDPDTRVEDVSTAGAAVHGSTFPRALLRDGAGYAWAVRAEDGRAVSAWSAPCEFRTDFTAPAAPTVASDVYPANPEHPGTGGPGVPGEFTFNPNGSDDVVAYLYGDYEPTRRVEAPSGAATVTLTPTTDGPHRLAVRAQDAAGNLSPVVHHDYWVRSSDTYPGVEAEPAELGATFPVRLTATQPGAVSFHYQAQGGPETVIPVGADGTAEIQLRATDPSSYFLPLVVWTATADGTRSSVTDTSVFIYPSEPYITATPGWGPVGTEHEVLFEPAMSGVASYTYTLNGGAPVEVAADADGRALVVVRPTEPGTTTIRVTSASADGVRSAEAIFELQTSVS